MKRVKVMAKGGTPGTTNWRAVAKVLLVLTWLVVPALANAPLAPLNYWAEWGSDVAGFMENNTTWWQMSETKRVFYVYFPAPWIVGAFVWYELWFRTRRKRLVINGLDEGTAMLVVGDPNHKVGHLYDLACVLNWFKHITWKQFPRPLTGDSQTPDVTIYYRTSLFTNPLHWSKISTKPGNISYGYRTMWVEGVYRHRVIHSRRPLLDYEVLGDEQPYGVEFLKYERFKGAHRDTQEMILKDNYRMTLAEPGTAKLLTKSSMMSVSDDTRTEYLDELKEEDREAYLKRAREEGINYDGPAPHGE